jgi:hypothetical protein
LLHALLCILYNRLYALNVVALILILVVSELVLVLSHYCFRVSNNLLLLSRVFINAVILLDTYLEEPQRFVGLNHGRRVLRRMDAQLRVDAEAPLDLHLLHLVVFVCLFENGLAVLLEQTNEVPHAALGSCDAVSVQVGARSRADPQSLMELLPLFHVDLILNKVSRVESIIVDLHLPQGCEIALVEINPFQRVYVPG